MTPLFPARSAAEEFDSVLEGRATTAVADRYAELAATVQVLREQPEVIPRAAFVVDLRERLMLAAETDMVPAAPVVRRLPSKSRRNRRIGTIAASLVIVGGSAGMAAAASGAQPGQALYPIKRGVEQVRVDAHLGDASKGAAQLDQASTRLDELRGLLASGADQSLVDATIADFESSANAGADKLFKAYQTDADATDVATVRSFTASAMDQVAAMATGADPSSTGSLRDSADTIADIDQQATTLCASCGTGAATLNPPTALAAGSGAAAVVALVARPVAQAAADVKQTQTAITAAQVKGLKNSAQSAADKIARAATSGSGTSSARSPVTSTITSDGQVVPSLVNNAASTVTNLVGGLTSTVTAATGAGGQKSDPDPVGTTVDGLGKTVGGLTGTLGGTLGDTVDGITKSLTTPQH